MGEQPLSVWLSSAAGADGICSLEAAFPSSRTLQTARLERAKPRRLRQSPRTLSCLPFLFVLPSERTPTQLYPVCTRGRGPAIAPEPVGAGPSLPAGVLPCSAGLPYRRPPLPQVRVSAALHRLVDVNAVCEAFAAGWFDRSSIRSCGLPDPAPFSGSVVRRHFGGLATNRQLEW